MAPVSAAEASAQRGGIRFRRGSRVGAPPPVIPMIGVVSLDEERPDPTKKAKSGRKRAAKPAADAEAGPPPAPRKKSPPRAKKKVEG